MAANIGELEEKVLGVLWRLGKASAREVCSALEATSDRRAYSTVRTILGRLAKKGIVSQQMDRNLKVYIYSPLLSKTELEKKIVRRTLRGLLDRFENATISYLAENLSEDDDDIRRIRKQLREMKRDV
jgi:predicted transcriptional regulator